MYPRTARTARTAQTAQTGVADQLLADRIATLMRVGTFIAAALFSVGTALIWLDSDLATVVLAGGSSLLVMLPVSRLTMMAAHFVRLADRRFALIAILVIGLTVSGAVVGVSSAAGQ